MPPSEFLGTNIAFKVRGWTIWQLVALYLADCTKSFLVSTNIVDKYLKGCYDPLLAMVPEGRTRNN